MSQAARLPAAAPPASSDVKNRGLITISIMLATIMNSLDTTIANVALPHIQGSVSASAEQITWVLTSYIVAAAIMTPLTGFLADRFGRKLVFVVSIAGFTIASMLCGIADSLVEIVLFRLLQGIFGAALIPLSQAVLLDINPPERHGQAMAMWGAGAVLGPVLGPGLGGWLTDALSWRWVFFINLPIGILALSGVLIFLKESKSAVARRFDFLGFASLALAIGALQMVLDRGPSQDWFGSTEIWVYAIVTAIALWIFIVQIATANRPFVDVALLKDSNFVLGSIFGFFVGILLFSTMALLPPMMQTLLNYPVEYTGLVSMPRGVGSFVAMLMVGQLITRVNIRLILFAGLAISAVSLWQMTHFNLQMDADLIMISGFLSGVSTGLIFVPLSTLAFATIQPQMRAEAASLYTLIRNIGSSVGISAMQANYVSGVEVAHARLVEHVRPDNPIVQAYLGGGAFTDPASLASLNATITQQAMMISYVADFSLLLVISIACVPFLLVLRTPKLGAKPDAHAAID